MLFDDLACRFCTNRRLSKTNSLLARYPDLALWFDPVLNKERTANKVIYSDSSVFFWRCPSNHTFKATIRTLVKRKEDNVTLCPVCKREERQTMLLAEEYPELFEESYNWLNCPTLRKPSQPTELPPDIPEDVLTPIPFEQLYLDPEKVTLSKNISKSVSQVQETPSTMDPVNESLNRVLQNHYIEYRKWKETLRSDDKRIVWWVCSFNVNHIWRESVQTRIRNSTGSF